MSSNPFAPPRAVVADAPHAAGAWADQRKPAAAWVLQGICLLVVVAFAARLTSDIRAGVLEGLGRVGGGVFVVLLSAVVAGPPLLTLYGTQRRMRLGRWSGVIFLALLIAAGLCIIGKALHDIDGGRHPVFERNFYVVLGSVWLFGLGACLWGFAFSRAARAWFAPRAPKPT